LRASDSTHRVLFIESKLRDRHAARTLHDATKKHAAKENKVPILTLFDKHRPGCLFIVHSDDFLAVAAEFVAALSDEERERFEGLARTAWGRQHKNGETA
jgi:hypothetical protein